MSIMKAYYNRSTRTFANNDFHTWDFINKLKGHNPSSRQPKTNNLYNLLVKNLEIFKF